MSAPGLSLPPGWRAFIAELQRLGLPPYAPDRPGQGAAAMTRAVGFTRVLSGVALAAAIGMDASPANASVQTLSKKVDGVTVQYQVVLPNGYDPAKAYPAILGF